MDTLSASKHLKTESDAVDHRISFLMRYADRFRDVDTIWEHEQVVREYGYCWFGKFGQGVSGKIVGYTGRQLGEGITTSLYLATWAELLYVATVLDIASYAKKDTAPESQMVPGYYRNESCNVWFKLTDFRKAPEGTLSGLALFHDKTKRPSLQTRRGLMYVTDI